MLEQKDIQAIVDQISYKDWRFYIGKNEEHFYLQIIFQAPDNRTGEDSEQKCRKWQLSIHMQKSEIVRTAYKAVLAAEEHEVGEHFKYKDALVYNPHVDVEALVDIIHENKLDVREELIGTQ